MTSYLRRANEAMEKLMVVDKTISNIQLNNKQVEFFYGILLRIPFR